MYTLEQIKNFTPKERNEFIDELIKIISGYNIFYVSIFTAISNSTFGIWKYEQKLEVMEIIKIPKSDQLWSVNYKDRISFLKALKTAE